jgi:phosphoribosylformylglycinamidine synthase subunit PurL
VSVSPAHVDEVLSRARAAGVPAARIGRTGGSRLRISVGGQPAIDCDVAEAEHLWSSSIEKFFARQVA